MSKITGVVIEADRGTTVRSPNFFAVEESTADYPTLEAIEAGIIAGELTPVDPDDYSYRGLVKRDYNQPTMVSLDINIEEVATQADPSTTYKVVNFTIIPVQTAQWDNQQHTLIFDILRTNKTNIEDVDIWVKGKINVSPTITE